MILNASARYPWQAPSRTQFRFTFEICRNRGNIYRCCLAFSPSNKYSGSKGGSFQFAKVPRFRVYWRDCPVQKKLKEDPVACPFEDVRICWIGPIGSGPDPRKRFPFIRSARQTRRLSLSRGSRNITQIPPLSVDNPSTSPCRAIVSSISFPASPVKGCEFKPLD